MNWKLLSLQVERTRMIKKIPWMIENCFGPIPRNSKNPETGFGFVRGTETRSHITQAELVDALRKDRNLRIRLCWTPEHSHLVTPEEVPELYPFLVERKMAAAKNPLSLFFAIIAVLLYGGILIWGLMDAIKSGIDQPFDPQMYTGLQYLTLMFFLFGIAPLFQNWWSMRQTRSFSVTEIRIEIPESRYGVWVARKTAPWTISLIVCIVFVGWVQLMAGQEVSIQAAGLVKGSVWDGAWWRLMTAPLLHANLMHIVMNMTMLFSLGKMIEVTTSRFYLFLVFLASAFSGSLFSLLLIPAKTSIGASGGIMGLLGFLIAFGYLHQGVFPKAYLRALVSNALFIALIGVIGFGFIDNAAHLGGFLMGMVLGVCLARNFRTIPQPVSFSLDVSTALLGITILTLVSVVVVQVLGNLPS